MVRIAASAANSQCIHLARLSVKEVLLKSNCILDLESTFGLVGGTGMNKKENPDEAFVHNLLWHHEEKDSCIHGRIKSALTKPHPRHF